MIENLKENKSPYLKWGAPILLVVFLVLLYFVPRVIYYSDYRLVSMIIFPVRLFIIPVLMLITFAVSLGQSVKFSVITTVMITLLVIMPTYQSFQESRKLAELRKNGVWTTGRVIKKNPSKTVAATHPEINCRFEASSHSYETGFILDDMDNLHNVGDTVAIIYSKDFPKMNMSGFIFHIYRYR